MNAMKAETVVIGAGIVGTCTALELARRFERSDEPTEMDTLGWAYYRNGDYPAAIRLLERVVASVGARGNSPAG